MTLTVTDSKNNRSTTAQTSVTVGASEKLAVALSADIKSMATKPGRFVRTALHGDGHRHGHDRF